MLIEYQVPSPKAGIKEHQSREVAAALIAAGFAKAVPVKDEDRPLGKDDVAPERKPRGWEVGLFSYGDEQKPVIIFHDGAFGKTLFDGVPGPKKVWSAAEQRHILEYPDCPQDVVEKFLKLTASTEASARVQAEAYRKALENAQRSKL
jgi:hypothetical protein